MDIDKIKNYEKFKSDSTILEFLNTDLEKLKRLDCGELNFTEIHEDIKEIHTRFLDALEMIISNDKIEQRLIAIVLEKIKEFYNSCIKPVKDYKLTKDDTPGFGTRNSIIQRCRNNIKDLYYPGGNNFLLIYNTLASSQKIDLEKEKSEIQQAKEFSQGILKEIGGIETEVRVKVSKHILSNYANIFLGQADKHSHKPFQKSFRLGGAAEKWLLAGIVCLAAFIIFLVLSAYNFEIIQDNKINYSLLTAKISIIVVLIYLITFSFKQFSINKHLYTLNKHRENTLNSYKLFIETIDKDDSQIRNTLMLEVAKAIFDSKKQDIWQKKERK